MKTRASTDSPLLLDLAKEGPSLQFESEARQQGHTHIAGADEAGRGPLAGPVVAAAVILDIWMIPDGLNDSKQLTRGRREELFAEIMASAIVSIASSSAVTIDATDIRKASLDAMQRAISGLSQKPCFALFDGCDVPDGLICPGRSIVRGDARSLSIAAASIVAKVTRDRMMGRACLDHPAYGFSSHVGYGTPQHLAALLEHGASPLHRMSFRPLRKD